MKRKDILSYLLTLYILIVSALLFITTTSKAERYVYILNWSLYDSSMHIDIRNKNSQYYSYIKAGMGTWNRYKSGVLKEVTRYTISDCVISDIDENSSTCAITNASGTIKFNKLQMKLIHDELVKYNIATHELGHALGLDHVPQSNDLMYWQANRTTSISLRNEESYDAAYRKAENKYFGGK